MNPTASGKVLKKSRLGYKRERKLNVAGKRRKISPTRKIRFKNPAWKRIVRLPIASRFLYTYPQPVIPKSGSAPWSNFNRYGWSIFARRQQVYLSNDEIKKLFSYLEKSESDAYLVALVCLATGARWGEAQALTASDVSNEMVHFHVTKSKKSRSVPVSSVLFGRLRARLQEGPFNDAYSTFTRRLYESGINLPDGQRTHVLRHTFASHYMMNGGNILALQKILGHASLDMTLRYSHLAPDYLREILDINPALTLG